MSSAANATQTPRTRNAPSGEFLAEQAANSDRVVCTVRDPSADSRVAHYFTGKYQHNIRNDFIENKLKVHEVGYPESSNILVPRSDMKGTTVVKYGIFDIETKSLVASINCITLSFKETSDVDTLLDICSRKNHRSTTYNIVCCS